MTSSEAIALVAGESRVEWRPTSGEKPKSGVVEKQHLSGFTVLFDDGERCSYEYAHAEQVHRAHGYR